MIRDLQPFPGPMAGHGRFTHPANGKTPWQVMTEYNMFRLPAAEFLQAKYDLPRGDPRLAPFLQHLGAKVLLRSMVFYNHKGLDHISIFCVKNRDDEFGIFPDALFPELANNHYEVDDAIRAGAGETWQALGNVFRLLGAGENLISTRALTVEKIIEHQPRLVFRGNDTDAAPDEFNRDNLALLPYQLDAQTYAIAYYVVTRDLLHGWRPERGLIDPTRYDMPEQRFDVTFGNLRGAGAALEIYDPLTGERREITALAGANNQLTAPLPAVDYPRFLIVREEKPGPLILNPVLTETPNNESGNAALNYALNIVGEDKLTRGEFPRRDQSVISTTGIPENSPGVVTGTSKHQQPIRELKDNDAAQITFTAADLTTKYPQWEHDVALVLNPAPTTVKNEAPRPVDFFPELPTAGRAKDVAPRDNAALSSIGAEFFAVAGTAADVKNRLPQLTALDAARAEATLLGGAAGWKITLTLNEAAHPENGGGVFQYLVWVNDAGNKFWVLSTGNNGADLVEQLRIDQ
jgi:hypothetical protein